MRDSGMLQYCMERESGEPGNLSAFSINEGAESDLKDGKTYSNLTF